MAVWAKLKAFFKWIHWLSLDVVLGAVGGLAFAFYSTGTPFSIPVALILGVSVWIIYLIDHLGDSLWLKKPNSSKYRIFTSHRILFTYLIVLLAVLNGYLIIHYLPVKIIVAGVILCSLVLLYLFLQQILPARFRNYFPKELIISIFYIAAIWFIPLAEAPHRDYVPLGIHFLLTLINVLLFSYFERSEDFMNHRGSCFSFLSAPKFRLILTGLCLLTLIFSLTLLHSTRAMVVFITITLAYLLEIICSNHLLIKKRYAEITDGAFVLFMLFIFWR
jgi:hypothetical protein